MRIKELRKKAGMRQSDLALALKINRSTVSVWEKQKGKPTADKLPEIAKVLHCTIDDLFKKQS